ncbi:MAG: DEAD/DEAH box helicase [Ichthyobacteriaceae bacterium]|nr:DEAD/DEAH box helicase [Ichthyobacteriaceae bacterium]
MQIKSQITDAILNKLGIEALNEMQTSVLNTFDKEDNMVVLSPTGSGKTLGFLLPILHNLNKDITAVQAIVLAPSRELALQIESVFKSMGTGFKSNCLYGGHSFSIERKSLVHPPAIIIGTPGRIADHLDKETFDASEITTIVLDEFDKALEFGFHDDMKFIIEKLPAINKRILTSATKTDEIPAFTGIVDSVELNYLQQGKQIKGLSLKKVISEEKDKLPALFDLLCDLGNESILVFCNHREAVERVNEYLNKNGITSTFFHGGMEQMDRERTLTKFRNGSSKILVTSDLASRGLDIPEIKHIIHYHLPSKEDAFTHRNGRTARMKAEGAAYIILSKEENQPDYVSQSIETYYIPRDISLPTKPEWATLFIGKGKKDKINKIDIVGFLSKIGELEKGDIGLIEVKDFFAYVAINESKINKLLKLVDGKKIKNKKAKIEIAR